MTGRLLGWTTSVALVAFIGAGTLIALGTADAVDGPPVVEMADAVRGNHDNWTTHKLRKDRSVAAVKADGGSHAPREVLLERASDSHFYADAGINGAHIRMMVDSGASMVALTRSDAEAIGIDVDRLPVGGTARTAGGEVAIRPVMLDSLEIEGIEVRRVQAAVIDADMGVSLLGQSYLSKLSAVNVEGDTMTLR